MTSFIDFLIPFDLLWPWRVEHYKISVDLSLMGSIADLDSKLDYSFCHSIRLHSVRESHLIMAARNEVEFPSTLEC